jgi:DMSO/TMAO reductase YedYZ molybdopterin-dependent catalytic subunit
MTDEELYFEGRAEQWEHSLGLSRAQLLKLGAAVPLLAGASRLLPAGVASAASLADPPIRKPLPPQWFVPFGTNAEMRWDSVAGLGYTTPNERFFVRNHTATPVIDPATWRLRVFGSGLAGGEAEFTYDQLRKLPSHTTTAFIECAGNGRSFFSSQQGTPASGTQWTLGAIGVATWRGVRLSEVLERAGIKPSAVDVLPQGLDANVVTGGVDQGRVRRPLPVSKALDDVLIAYEMNGEPLPQDHGFPARLVVPGWIGIASIKWLGQIEVSDQPLFSPWNTTSYRLVGGDYPAGSPPITTQVVKSAFELARGAELPAGRKVTVGGRSWSGKGAIRRVEVSIDRGVTWEEAGVYGKNLPNAWGRWTFRLPKLAPGSYELWARATDQAGRTQPITERFNSNGYLFGAVVRHPVVVRG